MHPSEAAQKEMLQLNHKFEIKEPNITLEFNQEEAKIFKICTAEEQAYFKSKVQELMKKKRKKKKSFLKFYLKLILLYSFIFICNFLALIYFFSIK